MHEVEQQLDRCVCTITVLIQALKDFFFSGQPMRSVTVKDSLQSFSAHLLESGDNLIYLDWP